MKPADAINIYWFALPLILAVSLVYAASRHESWPRILRHAARVFLMIAALLAGTMTVLLLVNSRL